jgi:hypothetical protein
MMSSQQQQQLYSVATEQIQQIPQLSMLNQYSLGSSPAEVESKMSAFLSGYPPPPSLPPNGFTSHSAIPPYASPTADPSLMQIMTSERNENIPHNTQQGSVTQPPSFAEAAANLTPITLTHPIAAIQSKPAQPDLSSIKDIFHRITNKSSLAVDNCRLGHVDALMNLTQDLADEIHAIASRLGFSVSLKEHSPSATAESGPFFSHHTQIMRKLNTLPPEPPRSGRKRAFSALDLGSCPSGRTYPPLFRGLKDDTNISLGSQMSLIKEEFTANSQLPMHQSTPSAPASLPYPSTESLPSDHPGIDSSFSLEAPTAPDFLDSAVAAAAAPAMFGLSNPTFAYPDQGSLPSNPCNPQSWGPSGPSHTPDMSQWNRPTNFMDVTMSQPSNTIQTLPSLSMTPPVGGALMTAPPTMQDHVLVPVGNHELVPNDSQSDISQGTYGMSTRNHEPNESPSSTGKPTRDDDDDDDYFDEDESDPLTSSAPSPGSDIPLEYRPDVDRIFFHYLNLICSNLDATDPKGEKIHQTLMAKKMQRLDGSTDFRPFKFRIQAFTNGFLRELADQGYPDEKIPVRKVRQYLWRQPHILRFNEDGKKAKSKGNHIWSVEGRKLNDGGWEFRPFSRRIAGGPPALAYIGMPWSWSPHIWDPQAPFKGISVHYSSPSLPTWLRWQNGILMGTPSLDAESVDIIIEAKFTADNKEEIISTNLRLNVAPAAARPSLTPEARALSDSAILGKSPTQMYSFFQCWHVTFCSLIRPQIRLATPDKGYRSARQVHCLNGQHRERGAFHSREG